MIMLTDMFDNDISYHDYIVYIRDNVDVLARVTKLIIDRNGERIVCCISRDQYVTLKRFDKVEIISEEIAEKCFPRDYEKLKSCKK